MNQLSVDKKWWWDGFEWVAAFLSSDERWNWDGRQWRSVPRPLDPPAKAKPLAPPIRLVGCHQLIDLDEASFGRGRLPSAVVHLPGEAVVRLAFVAIGSGWVARRVVKWHPITFSEVHTVALVAPSEGPAPGTTHPNAAALPETVLRTRMGQALHIEVLEMTSLARKELLAQVPPAAHVTRAAEQFLETGTLPGVWGEKMAAVAAH